MRGLGDPDPAVMDSNIPVKDLPHCKRGSCNGLLRPHVTWFGESLDPQVLDDAQKELDACDLCLVVSINT